MLEKIKYRLSGLLSNKQIRLSCIAVMTAVTIAVVTLLGYSFHTVRIFDGETTYTVCSFRQNTASVLSGLRLKSRQYRIMHTESDKRLTTVEIAYSYPVYITKGEQTYEIAFTGGTVADALKLAGFQPDEYDFIEPTLDTELSGTTYIDYTDIDYRNGSYTEAIPHTTETIYTAAKNTGYTALEEGSDGVKEISYTEKLVNGVSSEKNVTGEKVVKAAVNSKQVVGTKQTAQAPKTAAYTSSSVNSISTLTPASPIALDANGNPVNYKSKITARATAYTYTGNNCSTGVAPQPGYIAVNPKVIPYGTKMYIKTADGKVIYGYAVAADTGGFIKKHPNGVDLFMASKSACISFGVRNVDIYILE